MPLKQCYFPIKYINLINRIKTFIQLLRYSYEYLSECNLPLNIEIYETFFQIRIII